MAKILLVDDDLELTELLVELLSLEGFQIDVAHNGQEALDKLDASYSLVLLDIMMPVLNGIETLKRIRQRYTIPVLMLTACGDDIDRVLGLELGADDYLPKPFNDRELVARIKAILRRSVITTEQNDDAQTENHLIKFKGLVLHKGHQQATFHEQDLGLTGSEFALLSRLIQSPGEVLSRELLSLDALGKQLSPFDRTIDMHMSNLRKKLPKCENDLPWFKTLRGRGYILLID
ncbi:two-component system response regulator CpxR [Pasteurella langaaensis DSM 22999]|uniref:Two-component system response regulator CpxR n=1 Tax=Alitibacter langaaensis DSM 22999 TaxID=1122935 RepID=A0A2U0TCZ2_9PAST|nr:response regulator [Pasteurella langaaensis]PVX41473.1 two-component system response regulator CpxR [Pasteurella langaaensis DSM 22999]